jgi:predicted amidophosphoribosyltransferase
VGSKGVTLPESFGEISIVSGGVIICSACGSELLRVADACPVCGVALEASKLQILSSPKVDTRASLSRRFRFWRWADSDREDRRLLDA